MNKVGTNRSHLVIQCSMHKAASMFEYVLAFSI